MRNYVYAILILTFLLPFCAQTQAESSSLRVDTLSIKYIDLVHCTHTDYGFTDHPVIAKDLHQRFIDIALDMALASQNDPPNERFKWTAEVLDPIWEWWQNASESRRKDLLKMIDNGQIAISGMPFHIVQPFTGKEQVAEYLNWIPENVRKKFRIRSAMQCDVNGFSRAVAQGLPDNGIKYIWMGINTTWGGHLFKLPAAFWWKMPDARKLLVWDGYSYWEGYLFFSAKQWRIAQKEANNTQVSWPREGDVLNTDEASVKKAHERCIERIRQLREAGYKYPFITLSFTNEWRIDNDGPMSQLAPFVRKWNELGLKPRLNLVTVPESMAKIEKEIGNSIDTYSGEWLDWWSFGLASVPRELQAARRASYYLKSANSPFWKIDSPERSEEIKEINRLLCEFNEHTFASNESFSNPSSLFNLGQINEKNLYAYRPYERAKWLLAQQTRNSFTNQQGGLYVVNTGATPYTGWIELDRVGLRRADDQSVEDTKTGEISPILRMQNIGYTTDENGIPHVSMNDNGFHFWVSDFPPNSSKRYILRTDKVKSPIVSKKLPILTFDENGWLNSAQWEGMKTPLFTRGLAEFLVSGAGSHAALRNLLKLNDTDIKVESKKIISETWAVPVGKAVMKETPYSWMISQSMKHPRLNKLIRSVEVFKDIPRVHVKIEMDRTSTRLPEIFYLKFPFPSGSKNPVTTNGGIAYMPYKDHLPNSCKDFFAIDSWVKYDSEDGSRIWASIDVPLVNFGGNHLCSRIKEIPSNSNELYAMLFDNLWECNYPFDCVGDMSFEFDLFFNKEKQDANQTSHFVDTYLQPIPVMINPDGAENKYIHNRLNTIRVVKVK